MSIFHFLPSWIIVTQNISGNFCACLASKQPACFQKKKKTKKRPTNAVIWCRPKHSVSLWQFIFPSPSQNCSVVITLGKMGSVILLLSISKTIFFPPLAAGKSVCRQSLHSVIFASGKPSSTFASTKHRRRYFEISCKRILFSAAAVSLFFFFNCLH